MCSGALAGLGGLGALAGLAGGKHGGGGGGQGFGGLGGPAGLAGGRVEQVAKPQKSGIGMGGALLAGTKSLLYMFVIMIWTNYFCALGGAGLAGGALLAEAFEHHDEREYEQGN